MPFYINRNFENELYEYFSSLQSWINIRPVNLGGFSGPGGGIGGPPGGIIGQLVQTRVAYDTSELAASGLPASGWSLLDNLNHIRNRITILEGGNIAITRQTVLTFVGTLEVSSNPLKIYNKIGNNQTITQVFLAVGTAPLGSGVIVDVHKNGTTIFTNQSHRPVIASGGYTGSTTTIDVSSWNSNEYITAHVDQIGTTTPGADLVVHVIHEG